jgi:hypothetical protein
MKKLGEIDSTSSGEDYSGSFWVHGGLSIFSGTMFN